MNHQKTKFLGLIFSLTVIVSGCGSSSVSGSLSGAPTATLTASPAAIAIGPAQYSTLTFSSTNADTGSISGGVGAVGLKGSVKVSPTTTTTYTYTATGPSGTATAQATVTVSSPAVTMTASANPIASGASTTLTVTATNASQVVITDNSDSNTYTLPGSGGQQVVKPTTGTTYMATATGANGSTATATLTVTIIPTATISASAPATFAYQPVTITFSSTNATGATLNGDSVPISGSLVEYQNQTTTYTLTVSGTGGSATASTTVSVPGLTADTSNLGQGNQQGALALAQQDADPNGSVGTKQFMEYINIQYQAYDKTTLLPVWPSPQMIGTPWLNTLNQGDISNCDGHALPDGTLSGIHLDAVIDFDRLASRWVVMGRADFSNAYYLCLAVSNTDDLSSPTLGWYGYILPLPESLLGQNANTQGQEFTNFPDWPKLGIWSDGYYVTMDLEDIPNAYSEIGIAACVFDRNDILLQGTASPPPVLNPACSAPLVNLDPTFGTYLGHSLIPADIDGTTAPPSGRPEYMIAIQNPSGTATTCASGSICSTLLNLWQATTTWSGTPSLVLTATQPTVDSYTPGCYLYNPAAPAYTNCVQEPPVTGQIQLTDSVGDRLMPRFAYRNFGTYESYLVSHTVQSFTGTNSSGYQTGIRWYEFRDNGTGNPSLYQSNTIAPTDSLYRFLPSIAQDQNGNAAVGYSSSDGNSDPGVAYSYWSLATTNATPTEITLLSGTGEELTDIASGIPGEWGTYSSMTVDPVDNCTFWYVNEFYPANSLNAWSTFIGNFQVPGCQ